MRNSHQITRVLAVLPLFLPLLVIPLACNRSVAPAETPPAFDAPVETPLEQARKEIQQVVAQRQLAVLQGDEASFMATVSRTDPTYYPEQRHWFRAAARNVASYSLNLRDLRLVSDAEAVATLGQVVRLKDGRSSTLIYETRYEKVSDGWRQSDYPFESVTQDGVIVMHLGQPDLAKAVLKTALEHVAWLEQTLDWTPKQGIVIKLYPDGGLYANSVKPDLVRIPGGSTDAGESVKIASGSMDAEDPAAWSSLLLHETAHSAIMDLTNDNATSWLQEGLAGWLQGAWQGQQPEAGRPVGEGPVHVSPPPQLKPLSELEVTNIVEDLPPETIQQFYRESAMVVDYFIQTYGMSRLEAVLRELASYPLSLLSIEEKLSESNQRTREAIQKVLGIPFEQFAQEWFSQATNS